MGKYEDMKEELSKLTVKELRAIARAEGICLSYSGATKAGCVGEIVSQRRYREMMEGEGS